MWRARRPRDGEAISERVQELFAAARAALDRRPVVYDLTRVFAQTPEPVYSDSVHFAGELGYRKLFEELTRLGRVEQIAIRYRLWIGKS